MTHTVIVPGVGGSEYAHWQSWLQRQLMSCSRVEQHQWNTPILNQWIQPFVSMVSKIQDDLQIVAHSFGCLTTLAALDQYPELKEKVKHLVLVAPANPSRFAEHGFAIQGEENYWNYFQQLKIDVPNRLLISENDPWLDFADAQRLATAWGTQAVNLGAVGHINVASGFGPFPAIHDFLISENHVQHINITDESKYLFRFAI